LITGAALILREREAHRLIWQREKWQIGRLQNFRLRDHTPDFANCEKGATSCSNQF
jgi:hypothetical protein